MNWADIVCKGELFSLVDNISSLQRDCGVGGILKPGYSERGLLKNFLFLIMKTSAGLKIKSLVKTFYVNIFRYISTSRVTKLHEVTPTSSSFLKT